MNDEAITNKLDSEYVFSINEGTIMSEEILDIIRCQRHGVFYCALLPEGRYYGLYFTSNRIIVAVLSGSIYTLIGKLINSFSL